MTNYQKENIKFKQGQNYSGPRGPGETGLVVVLKKKQKKQNKTKQSKKNLLKEHSYLNIYCYFLYL